MSMSNEIRRLLNLMEATETKTATKSVDLDFDDFNLDDLTQDTSSKGQLATTTSGSTNKAVSATSIGKATNRADTARMSQNAMGKLDLDAAGKVSSALQQKMADAGMDDHDFEIGDIDSTPQEPNTLPAQIRKDIDTIDAPNVNWHNLPETPGYRQVIGAFGPLFKSFGMNPANIKVSTTLTSGEADMQKLIAYIHKNGVKDDHFSLEAFDLDPELYHIDDAIMYHMEGETNMIIKERLGNSVNYYVYSASDEGHRNTKGISGNQPDMKRIN